MTTITARERLTRELTMLLGGTLVDVELEADEYNLCIDLALDRYRQRSGNSIEESFIFLDVQPDVAIYTLPSEVQEVITIYRRTMIGTGEGGTAIDPFSLAFSNNIYMIQNPGQLGTTGAGMLATYDFAMQFQSMAGRLFGRDVMFTWDASTKRLTLHRRFTFVEQICLQVYNARPEEILLNDVYAKPWLRSYSLAQAKMMLGQGRGKFQTLAGPQGGVTLNGEALKQEAKAELDELESEIKNLIDQQEGYGLVIG